MILFFLLLKKKYTEIKLAQTCMYGVPMWHCFTKQAIHQRHCLSLYSFAFLSCTHLYFLMVGSTILTELL